ncbi:HlyD family type I secretion periplasmic adaptor subunit [Allochromatium vinosum]|uniref:Membrane fusion protein (MFP) family protein n=1 Tax=Allochromatium vinosum (strain ATCC 17899 / DSM 180 / NBRC 103801 / NCIMB 10441 / D) TaxID=572477 RepID=D3RME4_ALLVD|nr:HlyD family type I secretion periplasmic adaptor subunit [Allochromatium vinosum]ADC61202.1 type I secretion membrane fusion protein, HlyD family [Allochromatium vinosum DSM 180]
MDITTADSAPLPTNDKPERLAGLLLLLLALGGFLSWAFLAPINGAAVASGVVAVESARKIVRHLDGGVVSEILVREGDRVEEGEVLVRLDDTEASARLEIARGQYLALRAQEARLIAERDGLTQIPFADELIAAQGDMRIAEAITGEQRVFLARRQSLDGEKEVLDQRRDQLQEQIRGLEALIATKTKRIGLYQEEIDGLLNLFDKGLGDKRTLREYERLSAELEGERAQHRSDIAAARIQIGETEIQIAQLKRKFTSEVVTELRDVETQLADLRERMRALGKTLERTVIRSPAAGAIVGSSVHTIGGVIRPGDHILDVVPEDESLIIEARVQPIDVDRVSPGLEADLRMSAFNTRTTPVVQGRVLTISADRLLDESTRQYYYLARIQVTDDGMAKLKGLTLQAGMPVEAMIKTGERTFIDYLVRPFTDSLAKAFREE